MYKVPKSMIVWKKAMLRNSGWSVLVKMLLPKGALCNHNPLRGKTRANRVKVLGVYSLYSSGGKRLRRSQRREIAGGVAVPFLTGRQDGTTYTKGRVVTPRMSFNRTTKICASGIHFFASERSAAYYLG